jgi:hypothetical protein
VVVIVVVVVVVVVVAAAAAASPNTWKNSIRLITYQCTSIFTILSSVFKEKF